MIALQHIYAQMVKVFRKINYLIQISLSLQE